MTGSGDQQEYRIFEMDRPGIPILLFLFSFHENNADRHALHEMGMVCMESPFARTPRIYQVWERNRFDAAKVSGFSHRDPYTPSLFYPNELQF